MLKIGKGPAYRRNSTPRNTTRRSLWTGFMNTMEEIRRKAATRGQKNKKENSTLCQLVAVVIIV